MEHSEGSSQLPAATSVFLSAALTSNGFVGLHEMPFLSVSISFSW